MTNQKWIKSFELVDMLEHINLGILKEQSCLIDAITDKENSCPKGISCRQCIENWLKAEKTEDIT